MLAICTSSLAGQIRPCRFARYAVQGNTSLDDDETGQLARKQAFGLICDCLTRMPANAFSSIRDSNITLEKHEKIPFELSGDQHTRVNHRMIENMSKWKDSHTLIDRWCLHAVDNGSTTDNYERNTNALNVRHLPLSIFADISP